MGQRDLFAKFHTLQDQLWVEQLIRSTVNPTVRKSVFPPLPDEQLQWDLVGSVGEETLRHASRFYLEIKGSLERHEVELGSNACVLDLGCGFGRHLRFFLKDVPANRLFGAEVNARAIRACKATMPQVNSLLIPYSGFSPFTNHVFHLVYAHSVFSHLSRGLADTWVGELARILEPGGLAIITTHRRAFIDYVVELRNREHLPHRWQRNVTHLGFPNPQESRDQYDDGQFIYFATTPTGFGAFAPENYGTALIPQSYVERHWSTDFRLLDFVDDRDRLEQAILVMQRK